MKNKKVIPVERLNGIVMTDRMQSAFPGEALKDFAHTIITITKPSAKQEWPVGYTFLAFVANGPRGLYVINCKNNKKDVLDFEGYTHPSKIGEIIEQDGERYKKTGTINGIPRYEVLKEKKTMKNKKSFLLTQISQKSIL